VSHTVFNKRGSELLLDHPCACCLNTEVRLGAPGCYWSLLKGLFITGSRVV